ncbi:hypothetical protein GCM10007937_42230 [Mesorhizobium albiziae]|nr:hypothetical protein GCM10007937_42230 [Mesorhizobium albiziae]
MSYCGFCPIPGRIEIYALEYDANVSEATSENSEAELLHLRFDQLACYEKRRQKAGSVTWCDEA